MISKTLLKGSLAVAGCLLFGLSAQAATVFIDFGTTANDGGVAVSGAGTTVTGIVLSPSPFVFDSGLLQITTTGGSLECDLGVTAATCGDNVGLSTSNAYGLGVGDGRIDNPAGTSETLIIAPTALAISQGWTFALTQFSVTGFSGAEVVDFSTDGTNHTFTAPTTNVPLDTSAALNDSFASTLVFSTDTTDNYSLATISFNQVQGAVPEPATFGFIGLGLAAIGFARRKMAR
jgi:hypothetical protein